MKSQKIIEFLTFFIGIAVGILTFYCICASQKLTGSSLNKILNNSSIKMSNKLYNTSTADELFNKIKILCLVLTHPAAHYTDAIHVKRTWGRKCNKLIFLSTQNDEELGAVELPIEDKYENLWGKVKLGFEMAYADYFNEFDWFLKADDDSYFIIENLRYMLYQYNPQTAIIIGHRIADLSVNDGYMSGGGYILSKKALEKFVKRVLEGKCEPGIKGAEDRLVGKCLQEQVLFIDAHDVNYEKQIFPITFEQNFIENKSEIDSWYVDVQWSKFIYGNFSCCSEELVGMHYKKPKEMYLIDYLIYHVNPFGFVGNYKAELPEKFTFKESLEISNEKSLSKNFKEHEVVHNFEENEIY